MSIKPRAEAKWLFVDMQHRHVISTGFVEVLSRIVCVQTFVLGPVEDRSVHASGAPETAPTILGNYKAPKHAVR